MSTDMRFDCKRAWLDGVRKPLLTKPYSIECTHTSNFEHPARSLLLFVVFVDVVHLVRYQPVLYAEGLQLGIQVHGQEVVVQHTPSLEKNPCTYSQQFARS